MFLFNYIKSFKLAGVRHLNEQRRSSTNLKWLKNGPSLMATPRVLASAFHTRCSGVSSSLRGLDSRASLSWIDGRSQYWNFRASRGTPRSIGSGNNWSIFDFSAPPFVHSKRLSTARTGIFFGPKTVGSNSCNRGNILMGLRHEWNLQSVARFPGNPPCMRGTAGKGRFRRTANGFKCKKSNRRHGMSKFNRKKVRQLGETTYIDSKNTNFPAIRRMMAGIKK